jgi:methionyl-tRNA synthetase
MMGFDGTIEDDGWKLRLPTGGQKLGEPEPLFVKLDEKLIEEETARLGRV